MTSTESIECLFCKELHIGYTVMVICIEPMSYAKTNFYHKIIVGNDDIHVVNNRSTCHPSMPSIDKSLHEMHVAQLSSHNVSS